jgi:hypothetical protein
LDNKVKVKLETTLGHKCHATISEDYSRRVLATVERKKFRLIVKVEPGAETALVFVMVVCMHLVLLDFKTAILLPFGMIGGAVIGLAYVITPLVLLV